MTDPSTPEPAPRALIAEDETTNAMLLRMILEREGFHVDVVKTGTAARDTVLADGPDLVFMDVQMPEMNGDEAVAAIRQQERARGGGRTPIIALSAHALARVEQQLLDAGCDAYMTKPVQPAEVLAAAERVLGRTLSRPDD